MADDKLIIDATTGQKTTVALTAEELAAATQRITDAAARKVIEDAQQTNATTVRTQLATALANLQAIIDTADLPAGTLTTLQLSNAARQLQTAVKALARNQRRLIRAAVNVYDGAD